MLDVTSGKLTDIASGNVIGFWFTLFLAFVKSSSFLLCGMGLGEPMLQYFQSRG
jgi:hypothetical protein